jgi:hypothetical protein
MAPLPLYTENGVFVRQSDLAELQAQYRIAEYPIVWRIPRMTQGGGFGDYSKHPHAWGVKFKVDGQWATVISARGLTREWSCLDKLERWFRVQGFQSFWLENNLDPVGEAASGNNGLTPDISIK